MKSLLILFSVLVALRATPAANPLIVVPNNLENTEGNSGSFFPFDIGTNSMRYQQVFDASQFTSQGSTPWRITGISFRIDMTPFGGGPFNSTLTNIQVNLSTTVMEPDSLSPVFAANVGLDDKAVYGPAPRAINSSFSPFMSPQAFGAHIYFSTTPFIYDPAQGNLLLDVRNFDGGLTTFFDAVDVTNDVTSSVWALSSSALSGTVETRGLITEFVANPVPEPATLTLVALSIMGFIFFKRRQIRRN
jgi:hypothetical protein